MCVYIYMYIYIVHMHYTYVCINYEGSHVSFAEYEYDLTSSDIRQYQMRRFHPGGPELFPAQHFAFFRHQSMG